MSLDQNKPLDVDDMRVLKYLFPDHKKWLRNITDKNIGFNTTTAKRTILKLEKKGYVANDKTQSWRRGQKIRYFLTTEGKIATSQIIAGEAGKGLFINILPKTPPAIINQTTIYAISIIFTIVPALIRIRIIS